MKFSGFTQKKKVRLVVYTRSRPAVTRERWHNFISKHKLFSIESILNKIKKEFRQKVPI